MKRILFSLLLLTLVFTGCKKEEPMESIDYKYGYFPLSIGDSSKYRVENIVWDDFDQTIDTSAYFLCDYIESATLNNVGDSLFRIEQLIRESDTSQWAIRNVCFAFKTKNQAFRVENNVTYVKLVFPFAEKESWNGNLYNSLDEQKYKCTSVGSFIVENKTFANSVMITQEDFVTLINSDVEKEVYAKGVGLIHSYRIHVDKTYNPTSGQFEIKSGYTYLQNRIL